MSIESFLMSIGSLEMTFWHHYLHVDVVLQWRQSLDVSCGGCCQQGSQLREETTIFNQVGLEQHWHHGGQVLIRQLANRSKFQFYVSKNAIFYTASANMTKKDATVVKHRTKNSRNKQEKIDKCCKFPTDVQWHSPAAYPCFCYSTEGSIWLWWRKLHWAPTSGCSEVC